MVHTVGAPSAETHAGFLRCRHAAEASQEMLNSEHQPYNSNYKSSLKTRIKN
jgi:hypothetical protein